MSALNDHIAQDGFRLRGTAMSRVDAFSDVVFGFALTLLVVSLEVPHNYAELHNLLRGFMPFAVSFLLLMLVWHTHFKFFRRYGMHDVPTIWLNGTLLFCVLFYVYPLKFMFAAFFSNGVGLDTAAQIRELTELYGVGFTAIYGLFAAMYWNAWRHRDELSLDPLERRLTLLYIAEEGGNAVIGILCCLIALFLPPAKATLATFVFLLIAVHRTIVGRSIGTATRTLRRPLAEDAPA